MTRATILHEAEIELWEAVAYYEERCPGLGLDFARDAKTAVEVIEEHPFRYAQREDGTRRVLLTRFPFLIVYTVEREQLWIIAFAHCKRRHGCWKQRQR